MDKHADRPSLDSKGAAISFTEASETAFNATHPTTANASNRVEVPQNTGPTFIQHQISFQRSSQAAKGDASALSRTISVKSTGSGHPSSSALSTALESPLQGNASQESHGQEPAGSNSSLVGSTGPYALSKTSSERSVKSVRSLHAVGTHPYGSLRVHSPSPTQAPQGYQHDLLKSGDVLIMRAVPAGSLLGFDTKAFLVKNKDEFDGIREIPAGAHFIWGGSGNASLRNGFWIMSAKRASTDHGDIHIRRWDSYNETIVEEVSLAEIRIQKDCLPEVFEKLKPYDSVAANSADGANLASHPDIWNRLTSCMKGALLTKITGHEWNCWQVSSTHDLKTATGHTTTGGEDFSKDNVLEFIFPRAARTFSASSLGRDRTEQAMDTSAHVMAIVASNCTYEDSDEIIGELQFCYLSGMLLGNLACMEQWAHIIKILFKAYRLALDYPTFFIKFIDAVHAQFIYDEEGLDGSIMDHDATLADDLKLILTIFKSRLNEMLLAKGSDLTQAESLVGKSFEALESFLWKWDWDLRGNYVRSGKIQLEDGEFVDAELKDFEAEDERGEFAPQVVELDGDGREKGLFRS